MRIVQGQIRQGIITEDVLLLPQGILIIRKTEQRATLQTVHFCFLPLKRRNRIQTLFVVLCSPLEMRQNRSLSPLRELNRQHINHQLNVGSYLVD